MKAIISGVLIIIGAFVLILIPNSEIHSAKVSQLKEKQLTFTAENILKDPELAVHSIKREFQEKLQKSSARMYSLNKQKEMLTAKIKSDYGQIDLLRSFGNDTLEEWKIQNTALTTIADEKKTLDEKIKKLNDSLPDTPAVNNLKKQLRDVEQELSLKAFKVDELNFVLLDTDHRLSDLENSNVHSREELSKNLSKTRQAYTYDSNIRRDLTTIKNVEIEAAMAGEDFGISEDGSQKLMESMAEISAIEKLIDKESKAYTSAYTASQEVSIDERLALIQLNGF